MALQWTSVIRELVCREVFGRAYADLRTEEAAHLDASNSPAVPTSTPGGVAGQAMTYVGQFAQWFAEAGAAATGVPDVWAPVYAAEVSMRMAGAFRTTRPEMLAKYRHCAAMAQRAWDAAIETYSLADASAATLNSLTITPKTVRLHAMRHLARRRPRVLLPIPTIDLTMKAVWTELWNGVGWEFRRRHASIAIATSAGGSAPTITLPSGEVFDSLMAPRLWYTDDGTVVEWVEGDRMASLKAEYAGETGKPLYFSLEHRGGSTVYWHFAPEPDQAYTVQAEVYTRTPSDPADADAVTLLDKLDPAMVPLMPRLVLFKLLAESPNIPPDVARQARADFSADMERLLTRFTRTQETVFKSPADVYGFEHEQIRRSL